MPRREVAMRLQWTVGGIIGVLLIAAAQAAPPEPLRIRMARLAFPSLVSVLVDVIKDQGLDRRHGVELQPISYSAISAFYGAQTTGETDAGVGGPHVYQRIRLEGGRVQIIGTYVGLSAMVVISRNPEVRSIQDLRGRTLAADMGSSEFQILSIYARSKGVDLSRDVTVVQASPPLARAQLRAERVDAAMIWEPTATLTMRDNRAYRIIFNGRSGWRELTGKDGWQLVVGMHESFARRFPQAPQRLLAVLQEGQQFLRMNLDDADRIVSRTLELPRGVLKEAVLDRRIVYDIRPSWTRGIREALWEMFQVAVDQGFIGRLPDPGILYAPR